MSLTEQKISVKQAYPGLVKSKALQECLTAFAQDIPTWKLTGITRGLAAPLLAAVFEKLNKPILLLTADQQTALKTCDDLENFLPHDTYLLPSLEILPYEKDFTHAGAAGERLQTLTRICARDFSGIVVAPVDAVLYRSIPLEKLKSLRIKLAVGDEIEPQELCERLHEAGYSVVDLVEMVGEFTRRGGIVDVFAFPYQFPVRIEFFGDEIESIREFDPLSQRSREHFESVHFLPRRENLAFYEEAEEYQSLSFFNYLPADCRIVYLDQDMVQAKITTMRKQIEALYNEKLEQGLTPHKPHKLVLSEEEWEEVEQFWGGIDINPHQGIIDFQSEATDSFSHRIDHLAKELKGYLEQKYRITIWGHTAKEVERLTDLIEGYLGQAVDSLHFAKGKFNHGFCLTREKELALSDQEIFSRFAVPHRYRKVSSGAPLTSLLEMRKNDYVVHVEHGIGQYLGIEHLVIDNKGSDFISLAYASNDKLMLPVSQIFEIERYLGADSSPPVLSRLGAATFAQTKKKVKASLMNMARELLELYAARESQPGFAHEADNIWQTEFEAAFPFEETRDQHQAIIDVKKDMERARPMDRLLCGDVGYGKTEVAMRAAFKAVMNNRQVALLVPTTILASQHYETFTKRLADYPVKVGLLSRFLTRAEQTETLKQAKNGELDIVIGTHRLLSADVRFKTLGLLVIDEEQRFGVRHKEKIKKLKTNIDVLTMTATPIPRTLHLALSGARDMSVINTPPADRRPIKTFVLPHDEITIQAAIYQEIKRGGQIFFVHNRIGDIEQVAQKIKELVPQIEIGIAHGRLPEKQLEEMMRAFVAREFDLLVTTTIIENGLDMPAVNTIIITRADRFGLSQLYQLRGRVGRADIQAYAYLFFESREVLTADARKRLAAIQEFNDLGAGFKIAMKDLEIRGTGNLLGGEQHGKIVQVGFDLYCKLLNEAIDELKGERVEKVAEPKIRLTLNAYLPDDYIPSSEIKVDVYKKIANVTSEEEKEALLEELQERFGKLPQPAQTLFSVIDLKLLCGRVGVSEVQMHQKSVLVEFTSSASLKMEPRKFLKKFAPHVRLLSPVPPRIEVVSGERSDQEILDLLQQALSCFSLA